MYDQTMAAEGRDEFVEKMAFTPLRESLDNAVKRLDKEISMLTERLQPLLRPDVPHDTRPGIHDEYQSSLGNQVAELHNLATRIATVCGRIEF